MHGGLEMENYGYLRSVLAYAAYSTALLAPASLLRRRDIPRSRASHTAKRNTVRDSVSIAPGNTTQVVCSGACLKDGNRAHRLLGVFPDSEERDCRPIDESGGEKTYLIFFPDHAKVAISKATAKGASNRGGGEPRAARG